MGVFTLQGGLKAVVWTDVFQSVIMLAGLVIVAVTGSIEVGGLQKVWEINREHGRINFFEYVSWQIFINRTRMFRHTAIIGRSVSFNLLVCIVSRNVETERLTSFSLFYFLFAASTQTPGFETRSGLSPWEGLSLCCRFGPRLSILFSDILR